MKKLAAFLATLALALALALASCSGDAPTPEATSTPAPTAAATPEAASTPALTATPTPEATLTPAPTAAATPEASATPEQACANGVAVAEPEAHSGLVADCEALLRARDALRGDASLDWGGGLAVAEWEGIAVSGEPPRVTGLDLRGKGLTGSIPRELRRLRLGEVRLGGNALTGCVPSRFEDASGDAARLGLPWCLRYDRLDAAAEVASAGEWAILGGSGEVLTMWEQLRSEAATLRVHQTDAGGNSWAAEFGAVAVNDLFEWRLADDCWVRYRVAGDSVAPSGASGRWEFPVEWITYAATGSGCTGAVGAGTVLRVDEAVSPILSVYAIDSPVRHGAYLVYPADWAGEREPPTRHEPPPASGAASAQSDADRYVSTNDLAEARRLIAHWRDPMLPAGWTLIRAESDGEYNSLPNYCAAYRNELGYQAVRFCLKYLPDRPGYYVAIEDNGAVFYEPQVISGHPAIVIYSPLGPAHRPLIATGIRAFDADTGVQYWINGDDRRMLGSNVGPLIEIARSLLPPTGAP